MTKASDERFTREERVNDRRRGGEAQAAQRAQGQEPLFSERSERASAKR
jgi:hypothetical protein